MRLNFHATLIPIVANIDPNSFCGAAIFSRLHISFHLFATIFATFMIESFSLKDLLATLVLAIIAWLAALIRRAIRARRVAAQAAVPAAATPESSVAPVTPPADALDAPAFSPKLSM